MNDIEKDARIEELEEENLELKAVLEKEEKRSREHESDWDKCYRALEQIAEVANKIV